MPSSVRSEKKNGRPKSSVLLLCAVVRLAADVVDVDVGQAALSGVGHLGVVVDGDVAVEDLLEEIVGDIRDEYDEDEEEWIKKLSDREYLIEGSVKLDDINDALGLKLSSEEYDSIGGLIIEMLDHLPTESESVTTKDGIVLTVDKMEKNRIEHVRLILPPADADRSTEQNDADEQENRPAN